MLETIEHDTIRELHMARPPVNALDPGLVSALRQGVEQAARDDVDGVMLSGATGLFSAGLDLPVLMTLDRDAMHAFWSDFLGLCAALARSPMPVVAAVGGHSPAGGAVLALFCDYRVMARGPFRIGLNEVQVGLPVPACIQLAMRHVVGAYRAERLMIAGAMLEADQALACGLVDELAAADAVNEQALAWLRQLTSLPRHAMRATRRLARAELADAFADPNTFPAQDFLDEWFTEEVQQGLRATLAKLKSKH
ncbi:MAG TPA: enoyl-CoA hydratase/isomerase family protein [Oleiagrimonas sp.]|nr:enoyl-CoA hydratase/isomerase family protein [Oleiagrimonas sp.]